MAGTKSTKKLLKALRRNDLVELRRTFTGADRIEGYVVGIGAQWVLLASDRGGEPNGWSVVRRSDLRGLRDGTGERFMRRLFELEGCWPPAAPATPLALDGTVNELIDSAAAAFPLVTVYIEGKDPDVCYIGRPLFWTTKWLYWEDLDLNAEWHPVYGRYRKSDITRIDIGGRYETALARVAGL